jgi:hypothetical protein
MIHYVCQHCGGSGEVKALPTAAATAVADGPIFRTHVQLQEQVKALTAALAEARRNEAVCGCGTLMSEHPLYGENHGAVAMTHPCPFKQERDAFRAHLRVLINAVDDADDNDPALVDEAKAYLKDHP